MSGKTFFLRHLDARKNVGQFALQAPDGWMVRFQPPARNSDQNARMHAMIGDIAKQWKFCDKTWHLDDMKRLLVDLFAETMRQLGTPLHHDGRVVPSIDGLRVVQLGVQTSEFYVGEASDFITFLFSFGDERSVKWSDESQRPPATAKATGA